MLTVITLLATVLPHAAASALLPSSYVARLVSMSFAAAAILKSSTQLFDSTVIAGLVRKTFQESR